MSPAPAPPLPARTVPRTGERRRPSPRGAGTGAPAAATAPRHGAAAAPATPIALGGRGPTAEAPEAAPTAAAQASAAVPAYLGGGGTEGGTEAGAGAGPPPAMAGPELLMPEPPEGLSAEERERIDQAEQEAGAAAATTSAMPPAAENVAGARAAVEEPEAETNARAAAALTEAMGERAAPSPEIEALCERIQEAIRRRRPPDEDSLLEFDPREATQAAGDELNASVQGQSEQVQSTYDQLQEEPSGDPAQEAQSLEPPPERVETPEVNAEAAVPDAVPAEDVSLDADVAASEARVSEAGMTTAPAELITDPDNPVSQAREGQAGLMEAAARAPQEVLAEQSAVREQARGAMQGLQARTLAALEASRAVTAGAVGGGMVAMGGTEVQMRTHASTAAQTIFNEARDQVRALLEPLPRTALERWQSGITVLSTQVEQESERFNTWKRERYAGIGGTALQVVEVFTGVPDWAVNWLNSIEENFGRRVCNLLREISVEVNTVIATCEEIISNANSRIAAVFAALPESLREWAAGEQANFSAQLEGLREEARSTGADFNRQISQEASQAVQSVRERIHAMREEAQGLLGQIAGAIDRFIEDPGKFIIEGLLKLVGISPAAFWGVVNRIGQVIEDIADDPLGFANTLAQALGQGFSQFFDNFGTHILGGFFEWLFSGLGSVGVQLPADFSLGSLITFFLQLMGITWERIRGILARHIGEENVALLERAYELIAVLIEQGPVGIFEMIKEQLNPQTILDQILSSAVDFLIEALIRAVTPRVIAMFNPAGAIVQAIEVIFRILKWIFENAARIFALVETVVNGAAELIAGNFSGMANAVEGALARLIAPVIDFLAGFLGLGSLPDRIADTIRGFQEMVLRIIDRVVAWIAQRARALLSRLGIGGEEQAAVSEEGEIEKTGTMIGETHTLTVDPEHHRVTLASSEAPAVHKVDQGIAHAQASRSADPQDPRYPDAIERLQAMRGILVQLAELIGRGQADRIPIAQIQSLSVEVMGLMSAYGTEFEVSDVVDPLPEFPSPKAGLHEVTSSKRPPSGGRRSHHVPSQRLAGVMADEVLHAGDQVAGLSGDAAAELSQRLRQASLGMRASGHGVGLSAILIHETTHSQSGGAAIHASGLGPFVRARLDARIGAGQAAREQILSTAARHLNMPLDDRAMLVNPQTPQLRDFIARSMVFVRSQGGNERAAMGIVSEVQQQFGQLTEAERRALIPLILGVIEEWLYTAYEDAYTQAKAVVEMALQASYADGPRDRQAAELAALDSHADSSWRKVYEPF